ASYMFGPLAGKVASALSIIACFGSLSGWLILQSEAPRAAAKDGIFPAFFAETNKNNVPVKSLVFTGVLMSLVLFMTASPNLAKQFEIVILLSVFASLLPYIYAIISLPILMINRDMAATRTFRVYTGLVLIGIVFCLYALLGSGSNSLYWGILMVLITIPLYTYVVAKKHRAAAVDSADAAISSKS
ncbi:MAG TPA: histidine-histamine antiporter, partial [Plesiomonas shigelloides]|nr:histidine-histamine antiporter [Plesiomonas shigelloides]